MQNTKSIRNGSSVVVVKKPLALDLKWPNILKGNTHLKRNAQYVVKWFKMEQWKSTWKMFIKPRNWFHVNCVECISDTCKVWKGIKKISITKTILNVNFAIRYLKLKKPTTLILIFIKYQSTPVISAIRFIHLDLNWISTKEKSITLKIE